MQSLLRLLNLTPALVLSGLTQPLERRQSNCTSVSLISPEVFGLEVIGISATEVLNYTSISYAPGVNPDPTTDVYTIDFCNVTVAYTHPGWGDTVHVSVWLPIDGWNGRLWAIGGGGYAVGYGSLYMSQAVGKGYATIQTDGGKASGPRAALSLSDWALTSPGNANLYLLDNYGSRALGDLGPVGKAITTQYYGQAPAFSYFSGCSGGGRQAQIIAQNYPGDYDGILSVAPALNIENFVPAGWWAHQVMRDINYYPPACEMYGFTRAAIAACDLLDGFEDGIISRPELCGFEAKEAVGQTVECDDESSLTLTELGAAVVEAAWNGPRNDKGNIGWFGLTRDTNLSVYTATSCSGDSCQLPPENDLFANWVQYLAARDPDFERKDLTTDQFFRYLQLSDRWYHSSMSAAHPDLSQFRDNGGKMISWHGLADEYIPANGSAAAYEQVLRLDPNVTDYYRYFEAPGVAHCSGPPAPWPQSAFDQLREWVEEDIVPETLRADVGDGSTRPLCLYPSKQVFSNGEFVCKAQELQVGQLLADQYLFYWPS